MLWSRTPARPRPALRTRLRLEHLDDRAAPSSLGDGDPPLLGDLSGRETRIAVAPEIVNFVGAESSTGWFLFTGQVQGSATVAGLTITFGGVPSLQGQTTTTASDGTFSLMVQVQTDGSDHGTVTAQTVADGLTSNLATCEIDPTP